MGPRRGMRQGEESWMGITEQLLRNELLDSGTDPEWGCHVTVISGAAIYLCRCQS